jgi:ureidoglycolate hydrolase
VVSKKKMKKMTVVATLQLVSSREQTPCKILSRQPLLLPLCLKRLEQHPHQVHLPLRKVGMELNRLRLSRRYLRRERSR